MLARCLPSGERHGDEPPRLASGLVASQVSIDRTGTNSQYKVPWFPKTIYKLLKSLLVRGNFDRRARARGPFRARLTRNLHGMWVRCGTFRGALYPALDDTASHNIVRERRPAPRPGGFFVQARAFNKERFWSSGPADDDRSMPCFIRGFKHDPERANFGRRDESRAWCGRQR